MIRKLWWRDEHSQQEDHWIDWDKNDDDKDSRHMGFCDLRLLRMYTILMVILWIQYPL
jgi:hypothetical protein